VSDACSILETAWEYISDPDNWTTGTYAKPKTPPPLGEVRPVSDITADNIKVCSVGAVYRAAVQLDESTRDYRNRNWMMMEDEENPYYIPEAAEATAALREVAENMYASDGYKLGVTEVNDQRGYTAVKRMFKSAIDKVCA
jgi:hypothetical protein